MCSGTPSNSTSPPYIVVLTGGIASGKTAVSSLFSQLGVPIIDTDVIARKLSEPGQPSHEAIEEVFGKSFLLPNGRLDRAKMRKLVFSNREAKMKLESILHPVIQNEVRKQIEMIQTPYCILVVPLFVESNAYRWVNHVLVVDTTEDSQIQRVMARDGIGYEQALAILNSQANRQERLAIANDVIDNNAQISDLKEQVHHLHKKFLSAK